MSDEKKQWKREISAGGVVYKKDPPASPERSDGGRETGQIFILLINPKSRNFGPPEDYWTFPKGKQDKAGEDLKQVALREVQEEGGVTAEIEAELGHQKYFRNWPGQEAIKFVTYFLMKYIAGDPAYHDEEIAQAGWFEFSQVEDKLKFDTDKEIFNKAKKFLTTSSD